MISFVHSCTLFNVRRMRCASLPAMRQTETGRRNWAVIGGENSMPRRDSVQGVNLITVQTELSLVIARGNSEFTAVPRFMVGGHRSRTTTNLCSLTGGSR